MKKNMKPLTSRRDFLKLAGTLPFGFATSKFLKTVGLPPTYQAGQKNVLVIVFDAFSAYHISTYGYQRETTPNISRLAERAIVYHNHYAGANFTTPGTASLLSGTLPWTHRAFQSNGTVDESFVAHNIFNAFQKYYSIAYTQNPWANTLLEQFKNDINELVPWFSLFLKSFDDNFIHGLFKNDDDIASVSWARNTNIREGGYAYSLLFSHIYQLLREKNVADVKKRFPRGIPSIQSSQNSFTLEDANNWIVERLPLIPQPFLGYFHFLPPHDPYRPPLEFYDHFNGDGFAPPEKPEDAFTQHVSNADLLRMRAEYDEYILYVDREFNDLFERLETSGVLENTWVVLTSDHGELFERGVSGHGTDMLYESVIRVPLMIFEPGRKTGDNIHTNTSVIDLLPTLLHVTGQGIPDWVEGKVLPPFSITGVDPNRTIYAMRSVRNGKFNPLTRATVTLTKGRYKLHYYFGYKEYNVNELVKLYDVESDPDELVDLASSHGDIANEMLTELKIKLDDVNERYR